MAAALATRTKQQPAPGGAAAAKPKSGGPGAAAPSAAVAAVPRAVALASRMAAGQQAAAAAADAAKARQAKRAKKNASKAAAAKGGAGAGAGAGVRAGLAKAKGKAKVDTRLLVSRNQMKKQNHRGMVVIPQVGAVGSRRGRGPKEARGRGGGAGGVVDTSPNLTKPNAGLGRWRRRWGGQDGSWLATACVCSKSCVCLCALSHSL